MGLRLALGSREYGMDMATFEPQPTHHIPCHDGTAQGSKSRSTNSQLYTHTLLREVHDVPGGDTTATTGYCEPEKR